MSATTTITVTGMTCGHCAASVREEISEIAGVQQVDVDVASGRVDITSDAPLDSAVVGAAVAEAGYQVQ
ncbi:heavy-metal-associated domain-containing protein [Gordonia sp. (in: high G+C Gram-positive bacteria)]|uniref:heavy-metal-associated domain-containing protein n=1 Tax=Gordonia sp. (in: high G+C Gram-positive bacteria) TaxID=84139 RepID=UPI00168E946F|nr:heavy-metal-associated domain-containing protein [Gordonia sp. (in: high G+C Gram-positive bacteria)]NLG44881.1 heavy-metal-associated domain-containing protein [Gordonia sp. (in: high G+C Gram-positive bacteria)]